MPSLKNVFLKHAAQTSHMPLALEVSRASGIYIYDTEGNQFLDLISGISVSSIGHCHPHVVNAIHEQSAQYMHTMVYGEHVQHTQVKLCKKLSDLLPEQLNSTYLLNSGSEAVDAAIKLVRKYTGRSKIFACRNAYHGSSTGPLSLMDNAYFSQAYRPLLPNIHFIDFNNLSDLDRIDKDTAAVFIEPIQGEAGYIVPDKSYLKSLRMKCSEVGALLVFDEIQTGCGRSGKMFAFELFDVIPDLLLLAKGLGGGMPIGALVSQNEIMDVFADNPVLGHITTFGGHPVIAAAALATLEVIEKENLVVEVEHKSNLFRKNLVHPLIKHISGIGLMLCLELDSPERVQNLISECYNAGILTDWFLYKPEAFRIAPPLTIEIKEIEDLCRTLIEILDNISFQADK